MARLFTITNALQSVLAQSLHGSVDGRSLAHASPVPQQLQWVGATEVGAVSSASYIGAVRCRGNLMPAALRSARGTRVPLPCATLIISFYSFYVPGSYLTGMTSEARVSHGQMQQSRRAYKRTIFARRDCLVWLNLQFQPRCGLQGQTCYSTGLLALPLLSTLLWWPTMQISASHTNAIVTTTTNPRFASGSRATRALTRSFSLA